MSDELKIDFKSSLLWSRRKRSSSIVWRFCLFQADICYVFGELGHGRSNKNVSACNPFHPLPPKEPGENSNAVHLLHVHAHSVIYV